MKILKQIFIKSLITTESFTYFHYVGATTRSTVKVPSDIAYTAKRKAKSWMHDMSQVLRSHLVEWFTRILRQVRVRLEWSFLHQGLIDSKKKKGACTYNVHLSRAYRPPVYTFGQDTDKCYSYRVHLGVYRPCLYSNHQWKSYTKKYVDSTHRCFWEL